MREGVAERIIYTTVCMGSPTCARTFRNPGVTVTEPNCMKLVMAVVAT